MPSGLDSTTGEIYYPCITANATMTLALPKTGLANEKVKTVIGNLFLADTSVPPGLDHNRGIPFKQPFAENEIVLLV